MTIQTNLNDRKELARRLIPFNHNEKLRYTGTPAFAYEGRGFRILRSGDIRLHFLLSRNPGHGFPAGSRNPSASGTGRRNGTRSAARAAGAG